MTENRGFTIVKADDQAASVAQGSWVTDRRLGLTADRTRVVDYGDVRAAFLFRAPGKRVTAEESALYGITPEHPFTPSVWPAEVAPPSVAEIEAPVAEKAAPAPENKLADPPENKGIFGRKKRGA